MLCNTNKNADNIDIITTLLSNDIVSIINEIDDFVSYICASYNVDDIENYLKDYKQYSIEVVLTPVNYRICCEKKMIVNAHVNELIC